MNKAAIEKFAVWARTKLISEITYKMGLLGISDKGIAEPLPQSSNDLQLFDIGTKNYAEVTGVAIKQRSALVNEIKNRERTSNYNTALTSVIEEVAYTWFNRLVAVRFMEVNDYLPSHIRVLSSENTAKSEPDLVTNPFDADLTFSPFEQDRIMQLKDENKLDELFRMLFIKQCNKLHDILPELFERTDDYSELLLTISFTDKDGLIFHLTHDIPESSFNVEEEGQVEIIGWLYQYYNTELKADTYALLKKNVKVTKERIPSATQLFTPDWIVRYMVENSLGRFWMEGHPNSNIKQEWAYYLEEAEQEANVISELNKIRKKYENINPEEIRVIDPCMGSGHILVYAFDVLMQIYESCGYTQRDAARSIITKNLFGLDIDRRAYQLSYFALMMKARQYNRRILTLNVKPNLYAIEDNTTLTSDTIEYIANGNAKIKSDLRSICDDLNNAKEYGSLIEVSTVDFEAIYNRIDEMRNGELDIFSVHIPDLVTPIIQQAEIMAQKYDVVVTNPPYMGNGNMSPKLSDYVKEMYPDSKTDLFACFIKRGNKMAKPNGYNCMVTMQSWMFLSSFEHMRKEILSSYMLTNLMHMDNMVMGIAFGTAVTVLKNTYIKGYRGVYNHIKFEDIVESKPKSFPVKGNRYAQVSTDNFSQIPGSPVAYWVSEKLLEDFSLGEILKNKGDTRQGMATSDNNRFLRLWHEIEFNKIGLGCTDAEDAKVARKKWYPYNKGGEFRKWYGNIDYTVNYENDGFEVKQYATSLYKTPSRTIKSMSEYFKPCLSWSKVTSGSIAFRYYPEGFVFDVAGCCIFYKDKTTMLYDFGFVNSVIAKNILAAISPTLNYEAGHIASLPVIREKGRFEEVISLVKNNIDLGKQDWDSFETSWDFATHPLIRCASFTRAEMIEDAKHHIQDMNFIEEAFTNWSNECYLRFTTLKANEEELNRIFIEIYGLQDELFPEVAEKDVTVRKAELGRDVRSLISYAVGCMFGRYSLDIDGIAYAGGTWDNGKYSTFIPDADNCLPITDEEYFRDDIVGRFVEFIKVVYGEHTLEDNLSFIANALGNKGNTSREVIRNYFLNDFMADHIKMYQKRPIYWMFDSGKQNGFKALVYMHRWSADTIGNMRVEYLHRMQRVYESEIARMQETIDNSTNSREVSAAEKRKDKLTKQLKETKDYDTKIAHLALSRIDIDLDDGVKVNYEKVQTPPDSKNMGILTKIK